MCPINNIPALVQIMAWRQSGDKPLFDQWWLDYWRMCVSLGLDELNISQNYQMYRIQTVCVHYNLSDFSVQVSVLNTSKIAYNLIAPVNYALLNPYCMGLIFDRIGALLATEKHPCLIVVWRRIIVAMKRVKQ